MTDAGTGLAGAAAAALGASDPAEKIARTRAMAADWSAGRIAEIGLARPPNRPGRPDRPVLRPAREMAKRGRGQSSASRIALLHAIAHIELNAVDLACDLIARFAAEGLPRAFYDDWVSVADDEARHFGMLADRLVALGAGYGDLPAHDGLWEAALTTAHDLLARLAVVPLVLEARGLDVTPAMIANLRRAGDDDSVAILEIIYREEIRHVSIGLKWFVDLSGERGEAPEAAFHRLVRGNFRGVLKAPFNDPARAEAGLSPEFYRPLSDDAAASCSRNGRPPSDAPTGRRHRAGP